MDEPVKTANESPKKASLEKEIEINGSVGSLYALLALPPERQTCPMVIFSHGFGGDLRFHLWEPIIESLLQHGIGTLRFDFNGCGKSAGEFQDMTVPNEVDDLINVIGYVAALGSTENISLVGHSQGGVVSGMAAGRCGASQIRTLALLSAAAVLRDDALRGNTQGAKYNPWHLTREYYELPRGLKLGRAYIQTAMDLPIYKITSRYTGPALVLNGMADTVVPYTYAERYHHALQNSKLIIVPGENHGWTLNPGHACALMSSWLVEHLAQPVDGQGDAG